MVATAAELLPQHGGLHALQEVVMQCVQAAGEISKRQLHDGYAPGSVRLQMVLERCTPFQRLLYPFIGFHRRPLQVACMTLASPGSVLMNGQSIWHQLMHLCLSPLPATPLWSNH